MSSFLAKIGIFGIFILYLHLVYAQNFSLESQQFNSQGSLTFKITCIATNVEVLRWFATVDGQPLEFSRHSGIINDTYSFTKNLNWDEIGYEPPSILQHSGTIQFDVNATILAPVTFLINRNILSISCGSSSDSRSNSFILNVNDYLNISSNIEDVSELLCLGNVTFICNAELASETIGWYNNNVLITKYSYNEEDTFPLAISSEFGFDIQLFSASADIQSVRYINFSLSASLNQLQKVQGINLTCGTRFEKSDVTDVSIDTLIALTTLNAMYTAIYYGMDENLMQFNVSWEDLGSTSSCNFTYAVEVSTIDKQLLFNSSLTSEDCDLGACFEDIPTIPNELEGDIYLTIYGTPINGTNIVTAERNISHSGSLLGNNLKLDNCRSSITCSSLSNDTCTLQYGSNSDYESFSENVTLPVNVSHMFNFTSQTQYYIQLMKRINSVNVVQRVSYNTTGNNNSNLFYVVSGCTMLGITIILQIFGYIYCIISSITNKHDKCAHYLLLGLCISTLLFLLSLALLIAYLITPTFDDCGNRLQRSSLGVLTLIFFLLCAAVSPLMCGGFCLFIPKKNKSYDMKGKDNGVNIELIIKEEYEVVDNYNFTFGLLDVPVKKNLICKSCKTSTDSIGATKCEACRMDICLNCKKKNMEAFIPRLHKEETVCNVCNEQYWKENISIFKAKNFSEIVTVLRSQDSWMKTRYKDIHKGKELKKCGSCYQDVGFKYFKNLEFADDSDKEVCTVCYMLHKRKYHLITRYHAMTGKVLDNKECEMKQKELMELLIKYSDLKTSEV